MKLSKQTYDILKNFSVINKHIFVNEPKSLKTLNSAGNVFGIYDLPDDEEFPQEFAIYDLNQLLNVIGLLDLENTKFIFKDKFIGIKNGNNLIKFLYTHSDLLPDIQNLRDSEDYKKINQWDFSFKLNDVEMKKIRKASGIMSLAEMHIKAKDGKCIISLRDIEEAIKNQFKIGVSGAEGEGEIIMKIEKDNFNLIPGDYQVSIINEKISKFHHMEMPLFYLITSKA